MCVRVCLSPSLSAILSQTTCSNASPSHALSRSKSTAQVFDGAVIVLSLAPMVASTVANGPSSPWDAISLIITLRIWRVKRIIDGKSGTSARGWEDKLDVRTEIHSNKAVDQGSEVTPSARAPDCMQD